ncbi:MAG: tetratricopeptide repeat protein [Ignavibacteriales bacterium]|nr:MAG: tetratricopeptide repeat protein [Ignavibacteriales bacterium]
MKFSKIFAYGLLSIIIALFISNMLDVRFIQDDAYTSLRYVKNILDGKGLVFNEGERVEGYTNFLWIMILSGIEFLKRNFHLAFDLENTAQLLSIIFSICVLILTYILSKLINRKSESESSLARIIYELKNLLPVSLLAFSTPMVYWGVSAMETTLFVSLILLSIILYLSGNDGKPNIAFVIVSVLNSLLRPEGLIFFVLIIFHKILFNYIDGREREGEKSLSIIFDKITRKEILFFLVPLATYIIFRWVYYGYPLPNTFYAKTEFTLQFLHRGIKYFYDFAHSYLLYGFVLILPVVLFKNKITIKNFTLLFGLNISWTVIVILIGGDVLPIHRFFLPIMPIIMVLFVKAVVEIIKKIFSRKKIILQPVLIFVFVLISLLGYLNYSKQKNEIMNKRSYEAGLVNKMKIYAEWVKGKSDYKGRKISVALSTIGAFSYFSDAKIIDLVGLTDEYIAHNPKEVYGINDELPVLWKERHYNSEYVLSQKPDYIIFPAGAKPSAFAECAVFVQNEFQKNYYTQLFYSEELHQLLPIFTRREFPVETEVCNVKFMKYYINAYNDLLNMISSGNKNSLQMILQDCDFVIQFCPSRKSDALTIKGLAFYHAGQIQVAEQYLTKAAGLDETNSIARIYLKNIYVKLGRINEAGKLLVQIKRYSPDALPYLE